MIRLIFVDVEAVGNDPAVGQMTEFGAVEFEPRATFHGILWEAEPDTSNPAIPRITGDSFDKHRVMADFEEWLMLWDERVVFVSDNPAYDFMWINNAFFTTLGRNPFGHSGRRISDFYAGLMGDWEKSQGWKKLRITKLTHNPIDDSMGNVEAFARILKGER